MKDLPALELHPGRFGRQLRQCRKRRTGKELRVNFLGPARPVLHHRCGKLSDRDIEITKQRHERSSLVRTAEFLQPFEQRQARVPRRLLFFSRDALERVQEPCGELRRRLRPLQFVGGRSKQLVVLACQRGDKVGLCLVSFQSAQRRKRRFAHVIVGIECQALQRRDFVRDRRGSRGVHAHLPRLVLLVAAE